MKDAKRKGTGGFSLVEVLTAITVLGLVAAPVGASLVMSHRLNARSQQLMQAQLAVSNAVETLMAEGITGEPTADYRSTDFPEVRITTERGENEAAYQVTVSSSDPDLDVTVVTYIRPAEGEGQEVEQPDETS